MSYATLSLGSNLGNKCGFIDDAVMALKRTGCLLKARSSNWRTPPWGPIVQDWFINICIGLETSLSPHDLLANCLEIEQSLGRLRTARWGPRTIDIDILTYDSETVCTPNLSLPHPHMLTRAFVLAPLAEIAPHLQVGNVTIEEALKNTDLTGLEKLKMESICHS